MRLDKRSVVFGLNCYIASVAALLIAFHFDLPNPWWAVITVILTSQATTEGAIWAKALFRVGGTVIGLAAALLIIPNLVDAPELMLLALAAWLALCLYVSLLDRTPRSYLALLAGYGAILVGLPLIDNPVNIFNTAVYRTQEILIGVVCASVVHALVFPRSVHEVLQAKVKGGMVSSQATILGLLRSDQPPTDAIRSGFAASTIDIALQTSVLGFEPPQGQSRRKVAKALAERLSMLFPLIVAVYEKKRQLEQTGSAPLVHDALNAAIQWIEGDVMDESRRQELARSLESEFPPVTHASPWTILVQVSLIERLHQLLEHWRECQILASALYQPKKPLSSEVMLLTVGTPALSLHVDRGTALWSALNAAITVLICGGLAMWVQWSPATVGIGIAAVLTSLFATFDDPTPILRKSLAWTFISIPIGAIYVFGLLPAVSGFIPLAIVLFPIIAIPAALMTVPPHMLRALSFLLTSTTVIGLQPIYRGNFEAFSNLAIAATLGTALALIVTMVFRVFERQFVARRIISAGWRDLARFSRQSTARYAPFSMRMIDRIGLLVPRLPAQAGIVPSAMRELRIGMALDELRSLLTSDSPFNPTKLTVLGRELEQYCNQLARHHERQPSAALTQAIEDLRPAVLAIETESLRRQAITAWVGLRSTLLTENPNE